jgi:LysM repeat protein
MRLSEFITEADPASPTYHNMGLKQQPMPAPGSTVAWDAPLHVNPSVSMGAPLPSGDPIENVKAGVQDAKEFYDLARKAGMPIGDAIPLAYKAGVATATGDIGGMVQAVTAHSNKNLDKGIQQLKSAIKDYTDLYAQFQPTSEYYKKNIAPNPQLKAQADEFIKTNMTPQQFAQSIQQAEATLKAPSTVPTQASPTVPSAQAALGLPASQPAAPANETAELNRILKLSGMEFIAEDSLKSITVQRGDTLGKIAADNSTTVAALVKLNNIANPDRIYPGDVIKLPGGQGDPGGRAKRQGGTQIPDRPAKLTTTTSTGNPKIAMEFFLDHGWTPEQAAGLVANLQAESYERIDPAADHAGAYGIAQWRGSRKRDFEEEMGRPLKGSSLMDQLKFVQHELNNKESKAGQLLKQATTAAEAAEIVDKFYERSGGAARQQRIAAAKSLLTAMA